MSDLDIAVVVFCVGFLIITAIVIIFQRAGKGEIPPNVIRIDGGGPPMREHFDDGIGCFLGFLLSPIWFALVIVWYGINYLIGIWWISVILAIPVGLFTGIVLFFIITYVAMKMDENGPYPPSNPIYKYFDE